MFRRVFNHVKLRQQSNLPNVFMYMPTREERNEAGKMQNLFKQVKVSFRSPVAVAVDLRFVFAGRNILRMHTHLMGTQQDF